MKPKSSYETINYRLRPAKAVERKMLCEALRRLSAFGDIAKYRYVGFGSAYFTDFVLFHRALGIASMVSIEHDTDNEARFEFNKPFGCVTMKYMPASQALPALPWNERTIFWLDYDGQLDEEVLSDVAAVATRAVSGSVLIVSVNAHPDQINQVSDESGQSPVADWNTAVTAEKPDLEFRLFMLK